MTIIVTFPENRDPAETSLGALKNKHLEELLVVVGGYAPFLVVI